MLLVLEGIEQLDQPRRLDVREDIPLHQHMLDLVHLGERPLSHLFERANLVGIRLAGEVDGSVTALADLRDDAELLDSKLGTALAEDDAFAAIVRLELATIVGARNLGRISVDDSRE
jgi:hypothetical protein